MLKEIFFCFHYFICLSKILLQIIKYCNLLLIIDKEFSKMAKKKKKNQKKFKHVQWFHISVPWVKKFQKILSRKKKLLYILMLISILFQIHNQVESNSKTLTMSKMKIQIKLYNFNNGNLISYGADVEIFLK